MNPPVARLASTRLATLPRDKGYSESMKRAAHLALTIFVLGAVACSSSKTAAPKPVAIDTKPTTTQETHPAAGGETFSDPAGMYSITAPKGWETKTDTSALGTAGSQADVFFFAPNSSEDGFTENINVLGLGPTSGTPLDALAEASVKALPSQLPGAEVLDQNPVSLPQGDAWCLHYIAPVSGHDLEFLQYVYEDGTDAWVVTYSGTNESYPKYLDAARASLASFTFS